MAAAPYYLGYLILPSVVIGQQIGGIATFMTVALMFGLVPLIDPLFGRARADTTPESATAAPSSFGHRVATAFWLPLQTGLLVWLVIEFANVTRHRLSSRASCSQWVSRPARWALRSGTN
ncbi:MAG: hypothetical protein EXQ98_07250 [Alphaproteobacteria bacterium]|nr:hypothetical protein [Alphaproteobacteria bacterium]